LDQFIEVKGWKALGNRLTPLPLLSAELMNPLGVEDLTEDEKSMLEKNRQDIWNEEKVGPPPAKGRKAAAKGKGGPGAKGGSGSGGEQQKLF
jgi:hypothetical protein